MRRLMKGLVLGAALVAGTMGGAMAETLDLTAKRVIDAPVEVVWHALTDAEAIKQWWGPTGFTAPIVETDVRVGGASLVCMTAPGFPVMCNSWTYTEVEPNALLAFDNGWVDETGAVIDPRSMGLPPDIPDVVPHVLTLTALPDGKTELSWSEFGYASEETAAMSKMGLETVLDKLVASVE